MTPPKSRTARNTATPNQRKRSPVARATASSATASAPATAAMMPTQSSPVIFHSAPAAIASVTTSAMPAATGSARACARRRSPRWTATHTSAAATIVTIAASTACVVDGSLAQIAEPTAATARTAALRCVCRPGVPRRSMRYAARTASAPSTPYTASATAPTVTSSVFGVAATAWSAGRPAWWKRAHVIAPPPAATSVAVPPSAPTIAIVRATASGGPSGMA